MDFIFKGVEELTFPDFMEVVLQLRGSNGATVRDVVDLRKWVAEEFRHLALCLGVDPAVQRRTRFEHLMRSSSPQGVSSQRTNFLSVVSA
mmetsp:Transcript_1006/g.3600  ORF Transcript_1006/g.3600 Transcript_1006/m.3600 type:complete len:90 (-) Transcript_1006:153-422(-)